MPKGRAKKLASKGPKLYLVPLLAKFFLIKTGETPLLLIRFSYRILNLSFAYVRDWIHWLVFPIPRFTLFQPRRGRPRKKPLINFYLTSFKIFLKRRIPTRVKFGISLLVVFLAVFFYTSFIFTAAYQLPSPTRLISPDQPLTTEFYDRNGVLLYRLYEGRNRTLVELGDLPTFLPQATIAIEDKNFYKHNGVDLLAIARAAYHNFRDNKLEGASTITQQLIKNSLLTSDKTLERKIKEGILSLWTEMIYSKDQILAMYLNEAPYGGPAWGVEAAAQTYFGKSAKDLDLSEAAYLAGLPASPTEYSPYGTNPSLGKLRQRQVLDRMAADGYITKEEADKAYEKALNFQPPAVSIEAPHFVMYVRDLLSKKYGQRVVSQGGLKIYTTLDLGLQREVERIVSEEVSNLVGLNVTNGAAMVTDPKTGQILAMVGSRDYNYPGFGNFNVTLSLRQPGSSIKPITYVTAFKKGFNPGNTILDVPTAFRDEWGNSYAPVNYDGKFHGPVSLRTALGSSFNVPAVKLLATVGIDPVVQTARDLGITTFTDPKNYGLSLTLGGAEVKMIEMMGAYGTFSQNGTLNPPTPILKIADSSGNVLDLFEDKSQQVIQSELAYLITNILSDNRARTPAFGPNSLLNLPGVAVKTGTSDNKRDNWVFGYTPDFVVGTWVGNNNNIPMNPALSSGITGATPIWNKIMKGLLARDPNTNFARPAGIVDITIDGRKDLAVSGILPKALVRIAKDKDQTKYFDTFSSYATSSATAAIKDGITN